MHLLYKYHYNYIYTHIYTHIYERGDDKAWQKIFRSSHRRCSVKKGVLRNFTKFTRKTPVPESLFLIKLQA